MYKRVVPPPKHLKKKTSLLPSLFMVDVRYALFVFLLRCSLSLTTRGVASQTRVENCIQPSSPQRRFRQGTLISCKQRHSLSMLSSPMNTDTPALGTYSIYSLGSGCIFGPTKRVLSLLMYVLAVSVCR